MGGSRVGNRPETPPVVAMAGGTVEVAKHIHRRVKRHTRDLPGCPVDSWEGPRFGRPQAPRPQVASPLGATESQFRTVRIAHRAKTSHQICTERDKPSLLGRV